MRIAMTTTVDRPVAEVWEVLGPGYARAGDWASSVYVSAAREGEALPGAPCSGRVCETSLGAFTETIVEYDPAAHRIAYRATGDKMPGFVRDLVNRWALRPVGPGRTEVSMEMTADIAPPFNVLMGWMMRRQFRGVLREASDDFKVFVETGEPSTRKRKADASRKARAARAAGPVHA